MSQILQTKISSVRRKHSMVATATGLVGAAGAFVLLLAAGMLLDWWLNLSMTWRVALLALNIAVVITILVTQIFGPIIYGPADDEIALMVEDHEPVFRTRLIASVQLSRPNAVVAGASASLVRAMVAQAESLAGPMDFTRVIKTDRLLKIIIISLLVVIAGASIFAYGGDTSRDLLKRAFLSDVPVPRKTRVISVTDHLLAARGDSVEIYAIADGIIPESGRMFARTIKSETESSRKSEFIMEKVTLDTDRLGQIKRILSDSKRGGDQTKNILERLDRLKETTPLYVAKIDNVQQSFEYTVELNDGESAQTWRVDVLPRPAVTRVEIKQVYPAYTGKSVEAKSLGDLAVLQGSKLQLSIQASKPLKKSDRQDVLTNFVHLVGSDREYPLSVDEKNGRLLTGEFEVPMGTTGFFINLMDERDLRSKDPAIYRIDVVPDKAPSVRIVVPTRKETLLVRDAKQMVQFDAVDDYAIGKVELRYKVDESEVRTVPLDLKGMTPRTFRGGHDWRIADVQPSTTTRPMLEGSVIEYWIEVSDTRLIPKAGADGKDLGPNTGSSDHFMIRVVTKEEKRQEIAARIADIGSGLRSATEEQEGLANKVQTILLEKVEIPTTQPK